VPNKARRGGEHKKGKTSKTARNLLIVGGMAGASILLSPDAQADENPTPDTSSQGTGQTQGQPLTSSSTDTSTATATTPVPVSAELTQINTVLAVTPIPSETVTAKVSIAQNNQPIPVANAQVAVSESAVTILQTQITATQATAITAAVEAPAQAAVDNAQVKVTEAVVAIATAQDKKTQADTLQAAAGVNTTVASATAVAEDKAAVLVTAENAVDAQVVVVADSQSTKDTAQAVVNSATSQGLKVSTYAYNGGNRPALPADNATPLSTYIDTNGINEQWSNGQVANSGRADRVIVKYEGDITIPVGGTIRFYAPADDGTKVIINDMQIINDWFDKGGGGSTAMENFAANTPYNFTLWYYENGGGAAVSFMWNIGQGYTVVPGSAFTTSNATQAQKDSLAAAVSALTNETTTLTTLQAQETQASQHLASAQATLILATSAETARTDYVLLAQTAIDKTVDAVAAVATAHDAVAVYVPATYTATDAASLVTAINNSNATPANDTIVIAQTLISLDANLPTITKNVTIDGAGHDATFVDANGHNVFTVANSAVVTISDMTIQEASTAVSNSSGTVTIDHVTITSGDTGVKQMGSGVTTINNSTIIANSTGITSDYGSTPSNVQSDDTAYTNRIYVNDSTFVYNSEAISTERFVAVDNSTFYGNNTAASLRGLNKVSVTDSNFITNGVSIATSSWQPTSWEVASGNRVFTGNTFTDIGNVAISLNDYLNDGTQSNATAVIANNTFNLDRGDTAISSPTNDYTATNNTITPTYIDAPSNVTAVASPDGSVTVTWQAPTDGTSPERYGVFFTTGETSGWAVATGNVGDANALNTSMILPAEIFASSGGLDKTYTFSVRSDNDTLAKYSTPAATQPVVVIDPVAQAARVQAAAIAAQLAKAIADAAAQAAATPAPVPPTPEPPAPTPEPVAQAPVEPPTPPTEEIPAPTPEVPAEQAPEPETPVDPPAPVDPEPQPQPEPEQPPQPVEPPAPTPEPVEPTKPLEPPVKEPEPDPTPSAHESTVEALSDGKVSASEAKAVGESLAADGKVSTAEIKDVVAQISGGGELSASEKTAVAGVLVAAFTNNGDAVPASAMAAAGIDYKDLPPDTPVELANGVVIVAEVQAAFEVLADPGQLLSAALTDPGQVLIALSNLGADMSDEERKQSKEAVVATVVAAGAAIQAAAGAATSAAGSASRGGSSSSGGSSGGGGGGGGGSSGDGKGKKIGRRRTANRTPRK
jgi:hypothetical protein